ncbi:dTMP kinase [Candidatus Kaiserbacteria bacterium RIFCSPHIGHO2_02_FULL_50_50]|uniref:Thymidylate kinase n=1 Tax=Candidatus Kaiserbacteria bacterium RIFCSPHIGHO2_02_FULL_50_50 TaxID=1798492 RepID=A0A1F6DDR1_9BACT|nr:MAG: dTMP kinase [Candidatus Kaiserbacteria bacterium RIFCSPHIGHO2_02_FULL_50_50]OGG88739.1 MAG: dTMP kinase [Candidatus Kaiserbacteria bacterium RIFCSPLOWO2_12_FULL_50_10]
MKRGIFIVIDGLDGAGKTTAIEHLKKVFAGRDDVVFTREPGGTPEAEELREFFLRTREQPLEKATEILLVEAARAEHLAKVIVPALLDEKLVICDRFDVSTYVYNVPKDDTSLESLFRETNRRVVGSSAPDCYIFLNLPPHVSLERSRGRGDETRFDEASLEAYFERRTRYMDFFNFAFNSNVKIVDAEQSIAAVCAEVELCVLNFCRE